MESVVKAAKRFNHAPLCAKPFSAEPSILQNAGYVQEKPAITLEISHVGTSLLRPNMLRFCRGYLREQDGLKGSKMRHYRQPAHAQRLSLIIFPSPQYSLSQAHGSSYTFASGYFLGHSTVCVINGCALLSRHAAFSLSQLALTSQQLLSLLIDLTLDLDLDFSKLLFLTT